MTTKTGLPIAVFFSLIAVFLFNHLLAFAKPADLAQTNFNEARHSQPNSKWNDSDSSPNDLYQPDSPPVLLSTSPISSATNVSVTSLVLATFSEPVTVTNFEIRYFNYERQAPGTYRAEGNSLIFTPNDPLPYNTTFFVILWHIADLNGNSFEGEPIFGDTDNYLWEFTTASEPVPLPKISLEQAGYSVGEGSGALDITLALSQTSATTVSVDIATVGGSASESDYVPVADAIIFPAGTLTQTLTVGIVNDQIDEPDETFELTLSNPQNATLGTPSAATVTIIDNDAPPTLSFSAANYPVGEAVGAAPITLTLSTVSGYVITADYLSNDVTAIAGEDYVAAAGTLNILAGQRTATFTVSIINDARDESDETFNLTLSNLNHATLGEPASAVVTILDDDATAPLEVSFEAASYTGIEENRIVSAVVRLNAPGSANVSVAFNTAAGTATAEDFVTQSGVLSFTSGVISQTISIELLDDDIDEPDETFSIVLSNAQNATLVQPMTTTVTIQDHDKPGSVTVLINETDADQTGYDRSVLNTSEIRSPQLGDPDDTAEYVELYDGGAGNTPLGGYVVVFYDGSNNASYAAFDLDGFSTDANGYFVLGNAAVSQAALTFADNLLQDGEDAVALYQDNAVSFPNGTPVTTANLVDAIVYETDNDPDSGLLVLLNPGEPVVDEWVKLPPPGGMISNSMPAANSLQRCPNGSGGLRNTSAYLPASPTPGGANSCPPRVLSYPPAFSVYLPLILR